MLRGEVRVGGEPLSRGTVVLHRVSEETSGEIDSVSVEADGSFRIPLPRLPDPSLSSEIFFASTEYRGLLYFGPAITEAAQLDTLYIIQAYDTPSVPPGGARLPLTARNLFLERSQDGWVATDVFQIRQEGDRTLYSPEEGVVWAYPLPESATDFQVGQGDMAPDAVRLVGGEMEVYAPLPPGERFLMVRYRIPEDNFVLPLPGSTERMEILLREPAPPAEFPPLSPAPPVEMEPGNVFRRYAADSVVDLEIQALVAPEPWALPAEWIGLLVAGLLVAAGILALRLRARRDTEPASPPKTPTREDLILAIARLDQAYQESEDHSETAEARYRTEREGLLSQLKGLS